MSEVIVHKTIQEHKREPGAEPFYNDKLERQQHAETFTSLLLATKSNYVMNLNSEWGTGKTYFLTEWAEMLRQDSLKLKCIEINAWKHDHYEDAFKPIFLEITKAIPRDVLKTEGKGILVAGAKIITSIAKGYAKSKIGEEAADSFFSIGEKMIEEFEQESKSIEDLKIALAAYVEKQPNKKLFIFVDELDRCRPTFAVSLLERLKHLFDIDGVIFVIATDNAQLEATVRAFYGESFDSRNYLNRFFDLQTKLPSPEIVNFIKMSLDSSKLLPFTIESTPGKMFIDTAFVFEIAASIARNFKLSLRECQHYTSCIQLVCHINYPINEKMNPIIIFNLIAMRIKFIPEHKLVRELRENGGPSQFQRYIGEIDSRSVFFKAVYAGGFNLFDSITLFMNKNQCRKEFSSLYQKRNSEGIEDIKYKYFCYLRKSEVYDFDYDRNNGEVDQYFDLHKKAVDLGFKLINTESESSNQ